VDSRAILDLLGRRNTSKPAHSLVTVMVVMINKKHTSKNYLWNGYHRREEKHGWKEYKPVAYWGGESYTHPSKFRSFDKVDTNSQFRGKYICDSLIRIQVSLVYKLSGTPGKGATVRRSPFSLPSVLD
jgi:hypothetical protein